MECTFGRRRFPGYPRNRTVDSAIDDGARDSAPIPIQIEEPRYAESVRNLESDFLINDIA